MNHILFSNLRKNAYFEDRSVRELIKPGLILSFFLINGYILTARIMEGQWKMNPVNLVLSQIFLLLLCSSVWVLILIIFHEPKIPKTWQKAVVSFVGSGLTSILFYYTFNGLAEDYPLKPLSTYPLYWALFRLFNRGLAIWLFFYPLAYFYMKQKEWLDSNLQIEAVKSQQLTAQIKLLQQQMTPHFLFNSLNVLKSGNKDDWTKKYIVELSKIIRYQLYGNSHKQSLITLLQELQFVESYIYLLKERFEGKLEVTMRISEEVWKAKIPPYTLQTLVENAMKPYSMSSKQPLRIEIYDELDYIIVTSDYQYKEDSEKARQTIADTALENIQERYQLIHDRTLEITQQNDRFIAKAPLIFEPLIHESLIDNGS
ncbi:hypothetical protein BWI93_02270 [Siphonobacter sp. BAB-5385]|uniref:sensor histidine kinase n=1 Tax=Siphonobacter sp. BAB-5385 TaxID=1864822 RepID=UPI000B9E87A7|nr:histidine kinase [Siphonobacter sp. BAB-5385]OZI09711.1 hypothetical protein BWI93_02270 [Siphonobacter sp. BAB-5385]